MKKNFLIFLMFSLITASSGCSTLLESGKIVLGISTKKLEDERVDAKTRLYKTSYEQCYEAILNMGVNEEFNGEIIPKKFTIYSKNRMKGMIVVMDIPGNINTTEVGIFMDNMAIDEVRVEISSLSSIAKRKTAELVFEELGRIFQEI